MRFADLRYIGVWRTPNTDSVWRVWPDGSKEFLYKDSIEYRATQNMAGYATTNQLNLKLNISDTSDKWQPKNNYLLPVDTVNKWQGKGAYLLPADTVNKWFGKTNIVPFSQGGIGSSAATSATTGAQTVNMTSELITITPTGNTTLNASGGIAGQRVTFVVTTSGVSSFTITFGTNFKSVGTLATGTTNNRTFTVSFVYNGSLWIETGRTAAMA